MSTKTLNAVLLATVFSLAAASAAQAGGGASSNFNWRRGAGAAPVCDGTVHNGHLPGKRCPLLTTERPIDVGEDNGRSSAELDISHPMLAGGAVRTGDISF